MLTVMTWLWHQPGGRTNYTARHVNIWRGMVDRYLTIPHEFACVTDMPDGIDKRVKIIPPPRDFEDVRIPTWTGDKPQCLRRIAMFRRDAADIFGERFVSMDLDCVVADSLDPLFDIDDDFKMYSGTPRVHRPYNGSMLLMTAGARPSVYENFSPEGAVEAGRKYIGSDQAWISYVLGPGQPTWGPLDGVIWWGSASNDWGDSKRIMFFPGHPKPWDVVLEGRDEWVSEHYYGDPCGDCISLGYFNSVWSDLDGVLAKRMCLDMPVIASPEAAEYCDNVLAIADDDQHAERISRMYGYNPIWCGRTP